MTNPGPWTHPGAKATTRFSGLDAALLVVMIVSGIVFVFGVIVAFADDSPESFMIAGLGLTTVILCGLGRVMIHIAQTLDGMAADAREIRGISEWQMRQTGHTP